MAILKNLEKETSKKFNISAIHVALKRMEEKGFLESQFGEATNRRGGKRKRIYSATPHARKVLAEINEVRSGLWSTINLSKA